MTPQPPPPPPTQLPSLPASITYLPTIVSLTTTVSLTITLPPHPTHPLQNPPGAYAGRKALSRAFRSRFLELHVEELPDGELAEILEKRWGEGCVRCCAFVCVCMSEDNAPCVACMLSFA